MRCTLAKLFKRSHCTNSMGTNRHERMQKSNQLPFNLTFNSIGVGINWKNREQKNIPVIIVNDLIFVCAGAPIFMIIRCAVIKFVCAKRMGNERKAP